MFTVQQPRSKINLYFEFSFCVIFVIVLVNLSLVSSVFLFLSLVVQSWVRTYFRRVSCPSFLYIASPFASQSVDKHRWSGSLFPNQTRLLTGKNTKLKFYWCGPKDDHEAGILLSEQWVDKVFEVQFISDRIVFNILA